MSKEKNTHRLDHPRSKPTLFQAIRQAAQDHSPQFRQDFFRALRSDLGDLGPIFQSQEDADTPHPDYINLASLSTAWRSRGQGYRESGIAEPIQFLHQNLPQPIIGNHPGVQYLNLRNDTDLLPLVMVLDNAQFIKSTVEVPTSKEVISMLLADFIYATEKQGPSDLFAPEVGERVRLLMDRCDPDRVAAHLMRTPVSLSDAETLGSKAALRSESLAQELSQFVIKEITPRLLALIQANNEIKKEASTGKARKKDAVLGDGVSVVELPDDGAALTLLDARDKLRSLFIHNDTNGAWLNRPALWDAVLNTSTQREFITACVRHGAFEDIKVKKPASEKAIANTLLQGLALPGSQPSSTPDNEQAAQAFEGYMESVSTARDLSSVVHTLRARYMDIKPALGKIAGIISETAARIGYGPEDAYLMMSNPDWREGPTESSTAVINALNGGRWTGEQINYVFDNRPFTQHDARHLVAVLRTMVDANPTVWDQFTDATIGKLGLAWAYSGAVSMWNDEATYVQPFQARLEALAQEDKVRVFAPMVSWQWNDASTGEKISQRFTHAILDSIPDAEKESFIRQASTLRPGHKFFLNVSQYLEGPILQKEIVEAYSQTYSNRGYSDDLVRLGSLLGYGSSYDKAITLSVLPAETVRKVFVDMLYHVHNSSTNRGHFGDFSRVQHRAPKNQNINLFKNMAFDLHEHLTPLSQTPVKLKGRELLVRSGIAQKGDLLTWDGFCLLAAPFLDELRPALDAKPDPAQQQSSTPPPSGLVLDKDTLSKRIEQGSGHRSPTPFDFGERVRPPMHMKGMFAGPMMGMPPRMVDHLMSNLGWDLPPHIMKNALAEDAIQNFINSEWFTLPKESVEQVPDGGGETQNKSGPKPGGK